MANFDSVLQNVTILRLLFIADIWSHWRRRYFWRKFEEGWRNRETNFLKFRPRSATRCECRCRRRRRRRRRRHRCHRSRPHKSRRLRCGGLERRIQKHFFPKFTHTDCIFWHHPISLAFVSLFNVQVCTNASIHVCKLVLIWHYYSFIFVLSAVNIIIF